ncbi:MAG: hypothetical protein FJZ04_00930 [Candidatus Moranbacteria bacterium]|nr:hypothetical protein [Candidatus Moranbacteria bacterium]
MAQGQEKEVEKATSAPERFRKEGSNEKYSPGEARREEIWEAGEPEERQALEVEINFKRERGEAEAGETTAEVTAEDRSLEELKGDLRKALENSEAAADGLKIFQRMAERILDECEGDEEKVLQMVKNIAREVAPGDASTGGHIQMELNNLIINLQKAGY